MPYVKTEAIVLRCVPYSDTSLVAKLYTKDFGKESVIAKGARRQEKNRYGSLDALTHVEVVFLHKDTPALKTLSSWDMIDPLRGLRRDLDRMYAGTYAVELTDAMTGEVEPNPEMFRVLLRALHAFGGEELARSIAEFELGVLRCAGLAPATEKCAACGGSLAGERKLFFSAGQGGCLCKGCGAAEPAAFAVTAGTVAAMRLLGNAHEDGRSSMLKLSGAGAAELRRVLRSYLRYVLGREPRMWKYMTNALRSGRRVEPSGRKV